MGAYYSPAPELAERARPVIGAHHSHLWNIRVEFVWRSEAAHAGGKTILGKARKVSGLNALLGSLGDEEVTTSEGLEFFVIEIARDIWDLLSEGQRDALLDHELSHCFVDWNEDGEPVMQVRAHDLEEFAAVVERHGVWKPDIGAFFRAIGTDQLALWAENPPDGGPDPEQRPASGDHPAEHRAGADIIEFRSRAPEADADAAADVAAAGYDPETGEKRWEDF